MPAMSVSAKAMRRVMEKVLGMIRVITAALLPRR